ncbi:uncharacterized protein LY89DRAFT_412521 [Mollisia scopiformis]|uniref:Uncharacterized protein n=1 Tax=Mollisia scopiformis TaxID=149040 RepID=A0A132B227_MOLSC|nr:uncharacterized protein LY89DRAFT_412521 [Mollisia scopiformis]KUJ06293.1 hypothetical protein LY89DRAFT_412521 [Mollisia scopiformis]
MMVQTTNISVFRSEYRFLVASTVLRTIFIFLITTTLFGWWELGRSVTLNPLETAKAFDAPLLRGPGSNPPLPALMRIVGSRNAKFGEVETYADEHVRRQLKVADPVEVARPQDGIMYE